ncbi:MAG: pyruvate, phosphate dikinase [Saprospiraceae bacterium]
MATPNSYVYFFGGGRADGDRSMANLLGGKGANLAEMAGHPDLQLPVPPGFTISTEVCTWFVNHGKTYPDGLQEQVIHALHDVEDLMGRRYGDPKDPLLLSVRSGARRSMPGMMETILNLGLTMETLPGLIQRTGDIRFAYDAYRRLIMMYADVVMEKSAGVPPARGTGIRKLMEDRLTTLKKARGYVADTELLPVDLIELTEDFKALILDSFGVPFPDDPWDQLWGGIGAVFSSWQGKRAVEYRRIERIPNDWGTAVNVQAMVFGNLGDTSATGVAFTRNPGNGEHRFYGEYLVNAQGEDVVAGTRTPAPINAYSRNDQSRNLPTLEEIMPGLYAELDGYQQRLEQHFRDMQDLEFTIEQGTLYILQTRVGKRNGVAAVRMATEMVREGLIDEPTALKRVAPTQLIELLLPRLDPTAELTRKPIARGLPAGPGGARGRVVFTAEDAVAWAARGEEVILVREETSPEDVDGMHKASAILTSKGGMTSHAALVARGWGKCCIVGCGSIEIATDLTSFITEDGHTVRKGDWISLNGTKGLVYDGQVPMVASDLHEDGPYHDLMNMVDRYRHLGIRTNADTPEAAAQALSFGAEGIGLFRIEHMFYGEGGTEPLFIMRKVIMSKTEEERRHALDELFPFMKRDIKATLAVMKGKPVTIRLVDPPLHEFVPHDEDKLMMLAQELGISLQKLKKRIIALHENNPMLGHRGVRLGITYPEMTEIQVRAILEAAGELDQEGISCFPEIMIPLTVCLTELTHQKKVVDRVAAEVNHKFGKEIAFHYGTMIEVPRAALRAGAIAQVTEFFSFGTNDLTQMGFGFSRDDIGSFLPEYLEAGILQRDPFAALDQEGIGELVRFAVERGRQTRPDLKVGICGEHGGDPDSVRFFHQVGLDYVSCSPFRVPIARLAAAQAAIDFPLINRAARELTAVD